VPLETILRCNDAEAQDLDDSPDNLLAPMPLDQEGRLELHLAGNLEREIGRACREARSRPRYRPRLDLAPAARLDVGELSLKLAPEQQERLHALLVHRQHHAD
jgi:hypothetical protein